MKAENCGLLIFFENFFQEHIRLPNGLDPDQDRQAVCMLGNF